MKSYRVRTYVHVRKEYFEKLLFLLSSVLLKYLFILWLLEKLLVSLHSLI